MIARMQANVKLMQGSSVQQTTDPALLRDPMDIIMERVDHCKDLQFVKGEPLFGVMYTTIHKAAMDGSCAGISFFIKPGPGRGGLKKANVDDYDKNSICPIHYAAERGHDHVVQLLIDNGCDVDIESGDRMTAMMYACKEGRTSTIQCLWDNSAKLICGNRAGMTPAHFAAQGNHATSLDLLVKLGSMDRLTDIEAAKAQDLKRLADAESAAQNENADGAGAGGAAAQTTKSMKAEKKANDALRLILGGKKNEDEEDEEQAESAADRAAEAEREKQEAAKAAAAAASKGKGKRGTSKASHSANFDVSATGTKTKRKKGKAKAMTLEEVMNTPANIVVDTPSLSGMRPLHMAAMCNSLEAVRYLISVGVQIEAKDNVAETALHKAGRKGYFAVYDVLVNDGKADEQVNNSCHQTPAQLLKDDIRY